MNSSSESFIERHYRINNGAHMDQIVIREGLSFNIDEESRLEMENFCFSNYNRAQSLDNFLERSWSRNRLLDIGCLFGVFSLSFCAMRPAQRRAIALDPSIEAIRVIKNNCELNPDLDIRIFNCAIGKNDVIINMKKNGKDFLSQEAKCQDTFPMITKSIDKINEEKQFNPDIVKIDVDRFDDEIVCGMERTIELFKPDIQINLHINLSQRSNGRADDAITLLKEHKYIVLDINSRPIKSISETDTDFLTIYCIHP